MSPAGSGRPPCWEVGSRGRALGRKGWNSEGPVLPSLPSEVGAPVKAMWDLQLGSEPAVPLA